MFLRNSTLLATLILIGFFAAACGESGAHSTSFTDNGTRVDDGDGDSDTPDDDTEAAYRLELVSDAQHELFVGSSVDIVTRLTDSDGNAVAGNESISYEIIDSPTDPLIRLEALAIFIDEQGYASNRLNVGETLGSITVQASHQWVDDPVELTVDITAPPVGDLQVSVSHGEQHLMELGAFDVRIWRTADVPCQMIPPYSLPVDTPLNETVLPTLFDQAIFHDNDSLETYTVAAVGHGSHGQISGKGCVENIELLPDDIVQVDIPMELLPLSPTGAYDVISFWDFREALASTGGVGSTVIELLEWVANPGDMMAEYIIDWAEDYVCDNYPWEYCLAAMAAGASFEDDVADFIDDQVASVGFLSEIQQIGEDLRNTVANMKVESILTIENKALGEGDLVGNDSWRAITFYWTRNCAPTDPPDCGEIRIGLNDGSEFGVMEADWEGRLFDYDQLEIDPHDMTLPYGQLITYILNQHIIPSVTNGNANNLGSAVDYFLCSNIGSFNFWGINLNLQGACSMAVNALGFAADAYLNDLTYSIDLFMSGIGTLVDTESNSVVDLIEAGEFLGELYAEDGTTTDMEAQFTAERRP